MKLLILGGTVFVGRHLAEGALARGHEVTLFNRGRHNPELFPAAEKLRGDRDGNLDALRGRRWDAVLDTCGYVPRIVRASAQVLVTATAHYTYISSLSVFADHTLPGQDETAPVGMLEDDQTEEINAETYGPLKALCEKMVAEVYLNRSLVVRPGLIVGPCDPTDRFTYWTVRIAQGGKVLCPGDPARPVQFIDARDLAGWILLMIENYQTGVYNATGPAQPLRIGDFLTECRNTFDSTAKFTWVNEEFLLDQEVTPYSEMPLWVPEEYAGFNTINCNKAISAGLTFRPLRETIQDTLTWHKSYSTGEELRAGMNPSRETKLLQGWLTRNRS